MALGNLGSIIKFEVSSNKILTFSDLSRKTSAKWEEHDIIGNKPRSEFLGANLDEITFNITVSAEHGVKPMTTINNIRNAISKGTTLPLVVGANKIGSKWKITDMSETWDTVMSGGELARATCSITLSEYIAISKSGSYTKTTSGSKITKKGKYKVGDIVKYKGGKYYNTSSGKKSFKAKAGKAKIKAISGNKYPFYLVYTKGSKSKVHGWVKSSSFT